MGKLIGSLNRGLKASAGADGGKVIEGNFAVYNTLSEPIWGWYKWQLAPGVFTQDLATNNKQRVLQEHESFWVLGNRAAGTAMFQDGPDALFCRAMPPDTNWANDLQTSMSRGDIDAASIGWMPLDTAWRQEDGYDVEVHLRAQLIEASVVTFPAFRDTEGRVQVVPDSQEMAASLNRAINRAHHKLDMSDEDRSLLRHYRTVIDPYLRASRRASVDRVVSPAPIIVPMTVEEGTFNLLRSLY